MKEEEEDAIFEQKEKIVKKNLQEIEMIGKFYWYWFEWRTVGLNRVLKDLDAVLNILKKFDMTSFVFYIQTAPI